MIKRIIEHLIEKYQPKSIILHGSRVQGLNRPNSDWDLLLLSASKTKGKTEVFEGQSLDIEVLNEWSNPEEFIKTHGPIFQRASVLLDDEDNNGKSFLMSVQKILSKGKNLTDDEYNNRFLRMSRVLDKLLGSQDNPELYFMHAGVFAELSHRFWFEFKSQWSQPPYLGLPIIQKEDPKFYELISGLSRETNQPQRMIYAFNIYKILFPKEFETHPSIDLLLKLMIGKN